MRLRFEKSLGAGVGQLVSQFMAEGLLLSLGGAALGTLIAAVGLRALVSAGEANIPRVSEVTVDLTVLAATLGVRVVTAIFFGFAPLTQMAGNLHDSLKAASGRTAGSLRSSRFRSLLVSSELALALMLLIGTGLMIRAFWQLTEVNPDFDADRLLTMRVNLPQTVYPQVENITQFWRNVQQRVAGIPGVQSVTMMNGLPPERFINANDTQIENFVPVPGGPIQNVDYWQTAGDRFFETLKIRLVEGRFFDQRDGKSGAPSVIVNQTMARYVFWRAKRDRASRAAWVHGSLEDDCGCGGGREERVARSARGDELFLPYQQEGFSPRQAYVVVRAFHDPKSLVGAVRAAIRSVDPALPVAQIESMDEVLSAARSRPRFLTMLMGLFSMTALVLAAVGLYGVIS